MPRKMTKLIVNEISSVDRGAGEGVKVVLMKRDTDVVAKSRHAPRGEGPVHNKYHLEFIRFRRSNPRLPAEQIHALTWQAMGRADQNLLLVEEAAADEKREREKMRYQRAKSDNTVRKVFETYGVVAVAKVLTEQGCEDLPVTEADLIQEIGHYAASKGMTVGKLLNADSGEGALLAKACQICRQHAWSKQAEKNMSITRDRLAR